MIPSEINPRGPSALEDIEDKSILAKEGMKGFAKAESDEEEEKYLGIRGEENLRSAKDEESQTKLMTPDTTGERPETAISKVTVKKLETKEDENESEKHKLTRTAPLKVTEATKVKGEPEKFTTVDEEKGGANETAEIKEPQKNVTVIERAMSSGKKVISTQETEKPGHSSTLTESKSTAAIKSTKAAKSVAANMEKLSMEEVSGYVSV